MRGRLGSMTEMPSETGWRWVHGLSMQRKWEVQPESATAVCLVLDANGGGRATELRQSGVVVELFLIL